MAKREAGRTNPIAEIPISDTVFFIAIIIITTFSNTLFSILQRTS